MKENFIESISPVNKFDDLRGLDLSDKNFINVHIDVFLTTIFDTRTKWPNTEKMPNNFNPEKILEDAKNPGLGIKELHHQGITGKDINVAIIDQELDASHSEYSSNIINNEKTSNLAEEDISMHGPGVASLFVGKKCGVAPDAKLHYFTTPSGNNSRWDYPTLGIKKIIDYNNTSEEKNKIKVISYSNGYPNPAFKGDLIKFKDTIEEARDNGIIFIEANTFFDSNFIGGGSIDKENIDKYKLWSAIENKLPMFDNVNSSWNKRDRIIVPCDFRTIASSWNKKEKDGPDGYSFDSRGGISWSIPYLAGVFTLMLQINKELKMEEMVKIIQDTVSVNKDGLKIINPKEAIQSVKKLSV